MIVKLMYNVAAAAQSNVHRLTENEIKRGVYKHYYSLLNIPSLILETNSGKKKNNHTIQSWHYYYDDQKCIRNVNIIHTNKD